jgi:cell division protein FtsB
MAVKLLRKKSKFKGIGQIILAVTVVIFIIILYFPNQARLKNLRRENQRLIEKTKELETEIIDLEERMDRVGKDPYIFEKIARDELGVAKENELVIDIEE